MLVVDWIAFDLPKGSGDYGDQEDRAGGARGG